MKKKLEFQESATELANKGSGWGHVAPSGKGEPFVLP